jgi:hypothetical protein
MGIGADGSIDVRRNQAAVFREVSSVAALPAWLPGVISARQTSSGAMATGTTVTLVIAGPTGPIDATGQVTAHEPPTRLAIEATMRLARIRASLDLMPTATGTVLAASIEIQPVGLYRAASGMVSKELQRQLPLALERLRAQLEAGIGSE